MRLDSKTIISANHYTVLSIPNVVSIIINGWASKNKIHTSHDPDADINLDAADIDDTFVPVTETRPPLDTTTPENLHGDIISKYRP